MRNKHVRIPISRILLLDLSPSLENRRITDNTGLYGRLSSQLSIAKHGVTRESYFNDLSAGRDLHNKHDLRVSDRVSQKADIIHQPTLIEAGSIFIEGLGIILLTCPHRHVVPQPGLIHRLGPLVANFNRRNCALFQIKGSGRPLVLLSRETS